MRTILSFVLTNGPPSSPGLKDEILANVCAIIKAWVAEFPSNRICFPGAFEWGSFSEGETTVLVVIPFMDDPRVSFFRNTEKQAASGTRDPSGIRTGNFRHESSWIDLAQQKFRECAAISSSLWASLNVD